MNEKIKEIANRRYYSQRKKYGEGVTKEEYYEMLEQNKEQGGTCHYCGINLLYDIAKTLDEREKVPSLDHKIPFILGGKHEKDNLIVCCYKCNLVKGTLSATTYKEVLNLIKQGKLKNYLNERKAGALANKLERNCDTQ